MHLRFAPAWWGIGGLLVAVVILFSLAPPGEGASVLPDKALHLATYLLLGFWFASLASPRRIPAIIAVIALGAAIELAQDLVPGRHPEWLDFLANSAGALLALAIVAALPVNVFSWLEQHLPGAP